MFKRKWTPSKTARREREGGINMAAKIMFIVALFVAVGTAGAIECDTITITQGVIQFIISVGLACPYLLKRGVTE